MKILMLPAAACCLFFVSCAQDSMTGDTYSRNSTQRAQSVDPGRITSIRNVTIQGGNTAGKVLGGVAGGFLGSNIGSGRASNTAGAIGGALVGGAIGSQVEQAAGTKAGLEITVKLDRGGSLSVVQEYNPREPFQVGDRVRVLSDGATTRVTY